MFNNEWTYSINPKVFEDVDISLFSNTNFRTIMNYIFGTWGYEILKWALFISDLYTCIKLLAFNAWSNDIIKPYLPFRISKWLFSGCILASIILVLWEIVCGIRIYRTRNIALCYVNNFSRNVYSLTDYPKFCLFDKISARGKFQKFAFFVFFEIKDCIRLLFTDTPRQVINGLTLWSVLVAVHDDDNSMDLSKLESFKNLISKIKVIARTNHEEAVLLSFMLFSFILWAIFMIKLALAMLCSLFVYYRIINDGKYQGLREYVCISVSDHINELIENRKKKTIDTEMYKINLLSNTESRLEMGEDSVDASSIAYASYNDSSFSLAHRNMKIPNEFDAHTLDEPLPITSTINAPASMFTSNASYHKYEQYSSQMSSSQNPFSRNFVKLPQNLNSHTIVKPSSNNKSADLNVDQALYNRNPRQSLSNGINDQTSQREPSLSNSRSQLLNNFLDADTNLYHQASYSDEKLHSDSSAMPYQQNYSNEPEQKMYPYENGQLHNNSDDKTPDIIEQVDNELYAETTTPNIKYSNASVFRDDDIVDNNAPQFHTANNIIEYEDEYNEHLDALSIRKRPPPVDNPIASYSHVYTPARAHFRETDGEHIL